MTRADAQAFLALPDRSRTAVLGRMNPVERADALVALVLALGPAVEAQEPVEELAA